MRLRCSTKVGACVRDPSKRDAAGRLRTGPVLPMSNTLCYITARREASAFLRRFVRMFRSTGMTQPQNFGGD